MKEVKKRTRKGRGKDSDRTRDSSLSPLPERREGGRVTTTYPSATFRGENFDSRQRNDELPSAPSGEMPLRDC